MKNISPQLRGFLETASAYHRAELFNIQLTNGQQILANNSGTDLAFGTPPQRYYASQFGAWQMGDVTSEAKYSPDANVTDVTLFCPSSVLYPGTTTSLMSVVNSPVFDGAVVRIYSVYWAVGQLPQVGLQMGAITTQVGQIANIKQTGRSEVTFEVTDMMYLCNRTIPPNMVQSSCRHTLFDANCALASSPYTVNTSLTSGSTTLIINVALVMGGAGYYTLGKVTFTSGQNKGLTYTIKQQLSSSALQLAQPTAFPVATSDTLTVYPGCDKSLATCSSKFSNSIHFGGMPYVPNPEIAQ